MISFVNMPIMDWAVAGLGGDFFWPNFLYTIAMIPCVLMSWQMGRLERRESVAEKYVCVHCRVKHDTVIVRLSERVSVNRSPTIEAINASKNNNKPVLRRHSSAEVINANDERRGNSVYRVIVVGMGGNAVARPRVSNVVTTTFAEAGVRSTM